MLRFLPEVNLTIITNSLPVVEETYRNSRIRLHIAPGYYEEQYGGPLDYSTAEYVSRFHYNKAFFGTAAIDAGFGVSAPWEMEAAVKKCVYANADESYLLTDHTKFGRRNLIKYNDVSAYKQIITDEELDPEEQNRIAGNGGKIYIAGS